MAKLSVHADFQITGDGILARVRKFSKVTLTDYMITHGSKAITTGAYTAVDLGDDMATARYFLLIDRGTSIGGVELSFDNSTSDLATGLRGHMFIPIVNTANLYLKAVLANREVEYLVIGPRS